jgi:hypothetical protein
MENPVGMINQVNRADLLGVLISEHELLGSSSLTWKLFARRSVTVNDRNDDSSGSLVHSHRLAHRENQLVAPINPLEETLDSGYLKLPFQAPDASEAPMKRGPISIICHGMILSEGSDAQSMLQQGCAV